MDEFVLLWDAVATLVVRQRTDGEDDRFFHRHLRDVRHLCAHHEGGHHHDVDLCACHRHEDLFCATAE